MIENDSCFAYKYILLCLKIYNNFFRLGSVNNLCSTPKRRRYVEPRYISEITTPDVQTPKRASRIIKFVKNNYMKQKEHIKKLQKKNRNFIKRIKTLEKMVSHLRKMHLISEDAGDSLLV